MDYALGVLAAANRSRGTLVAGLCMLIVLPILLMHAPAQGSHGEASNAERDSGTHGIFSAFTLRLQVPNAISSWRAFTAAPGNGLSNCFLKWPRGAAFMVYVFKDEQFESEVLPVLDGSGLAAFEAVFCEKIKPRAAVVPIHKPSDKGSFRLDMSQHSRAYTWYLVAGGDCVLKEESGGEQQRYANWNVLSLEKWSFDCHQIPDRGALSLSAEHLWDLRASVCIAAFAVVALYKLPSSDLVPASEHRRKGVAVVGVAFSLAALQIRVLGITGQRLTLVSQLAGVLAAVGQIVWVSLIILPDRHDAISPHNLFGILMAITLTLPVVAGVSMDAPGLAVAGVGDPLQSWYDLVLPSDWLGWASSACVALVWSASQRLPGDISVAQPWMSKASAAVAAAVASVAYITPDKLHALTIVTVPASVVALLVLLQSVKRRWYSLGIGRCIAIALPVGALPVSVLPFIAAKSRHGVRLLLLVIVEVARLADLVGHDLALTALQRKNSPALRLPGSPELRLPGTAAATTPQGQAGFSLWHAVLAACVVAAMVCDLTNLVGVQEANIRTGEVSEHDHGQQNRLYELEDAFKNEISQLRQEMGHDISSRVNNIDTVATELKARVEKSEHMVEVAYSTATMLQMLEKDEFVREILANMSDVAEWWKYKNKEVSIDGCKFVRQEGVSLGALVQYNLKDLSPTIALAVCSRSGMLCMGITCGTYTGSTRCSPRRGSPWAFSPLETSYKKQCAPTFNINAPLQELLPTPDERSRAPARPRLVGTALVLQSHSRAHMFEQQLEALLEERKRREMGDSPHLYVSNDNPDRSDEVDRVTSNLATTFDTIIRVWEFAPSQDALGNRAMHAMEHYQFIMRKAFEDLGYVFLIVLEEEFFPSPDFLVFFSFAVDAMLADESLWCASAWNDYGLFRFARDPGRVARTSLFPGAGWLISNTTWKLLRPAWPRKPSDGLASWLRFPSSPIANMECLQPEVRRVFRSSLGSHEYFSTEEGDNFGDAHYVSSEVYEERIRALVARATRLSFEAAVSGAYGAVEGAPPAVYLVPFLRAEWPRYADAVGLSKTSLRGVHRGLLLLPDYRRNAFLIFADRWRAAAHVAPKDRLTSGMLNATVSVVAPRGIACGQACQDRGEMRCHHLSLDGLQDCTTLRYHFKNCSGGCVYEAEPYIPAFDPISNICYTANDATVFDCAAVHDERQRICACVPAQST